VGVVSKKSNKAAPTRVTLDLDARDYATLDRLARELRAISKVETMRRLIRFAGANPQIVNGRTA